MLIFYDPKDKNRIKAIYSSRTNSKEWDKLGYIKAEVPNEWGASQDHLVELVDGVPVGLTCDPLLIPEPIPHPLKGKSFNSLTRPEKDELLLEILANSGILEDGKVK